MRTYKQLTQEQRYQIYALMKIGIKQTQIANGRLKATTDFSVLVKADAGEC